MVRAGAAGVARISQVTPEHRRLEELRETLERHGVEYLVIGKAGAILYGFSDTTQDIDLFPRKGEGNERALVEALREMGFAIDEGTAGDIERGKDFVQIRNGPFDIDLVFAPDGIEDFESALRRAQTRSGMPVCALDDIIESKARANRARDRESLPRLRGFRQYLKERGELAGPSVKAARARLEEKPEALEVRLHGRLAGHLSRTGTSRLVFRYDEQYVSSTAPPLSVSLPLRSEPYPPDKTEPWFDGLLAEGSRRRHLARVVGTAEIDTWTLLRAAGAECAGAVQIVSTEHSDTPKLFPIDEHQLARMLASTPVEPIGTVSRAARMSIAGAQDKVTLYRADDGTWRVPLGGHPSTHILKPQPRSTYPGLVRNEHWCMTVARRAGFDVAATSVETIAGREILIVERYDRLRTRHGTIERIHQEDLAQALGRRHKYQADGGPSTYELFAAPGVAREKMFDRLLFSWLVGNCDAHAKNYSILEPGTPNARLAPIYDMVSTEAYPELKRMLATSIAREHHLDRVDHSAIKTLGSRIGLHPEETAARARDVAQRIQTAMDEAAKDGLDHGPIRISNITRRLRVLLAPTRTLVQQRSVEQAHGDNNDRDPTPEEMTSAQRYIAGDPATGRPGLRDAIDGIAERQLTRGKRRHPVYEMREQEFWLASVPCVRSRQSAVTAARLAQRAIDDYQSEQTETHTAVAGWREQVWPAVWERIETAIIPFEVRAERERKAKAEADRQAETLGQAQVEAVPDRERSRGY